MSMPSKSASSTSLSLRPALRDPDDPTSPKIGPSKVVSIAEPEPSPSPLQLEDSPRIKQHTASTASKRVRPVMPTNSSSRLSLVSNTSVEDLNEASDSPHHRAEGHEHKHREHHVHQHDRLLLQVSEWLQREKAKRAARKSKDRHSHSFEGADAQKGSGTPGDHATTSEESNRNHFSRHRSSSQGSASSTISLDSLQRILDDSLAGFGHDSHLSFTPSGLGLRQSSSAGKRKSWVRRRGAASSDTEYQDGDVIVPSCDVVLDNSKTMSYSGGGAESSNDTVTLNSGKRAEKDRKAWLSFKNEIVKLAHTLRLKGWRRVPLERGGDIEVERLSGALTNAVYVVCPPKDIVLSVVNSEHKHKPPPKLLLRIYGPQVEHLIDRESELSILRRLARKKIGPRLLGTFNNGRFEEFFNAQTLTFDDLRVPDTSKQIAKRMRELHDGIELLEREREDGPFVWQNWDKWVSRCQEVIMYLDREILSGAKGKREPWRTRGLICGVEWKLFKTAIDNYRKWLGELYRDKGGVNRNLVFAHNDTQYGNILRLIPEAPSPGSAPSPLLLPQNTHKQLVVIDFEYASANTPGLEFANHFTEWCYNYHDASKPWACNTSSYPTLEEQRRFIRSYLNHRPQFNPRASATPKMSPMDNLARGSISEFLLDSRTPGSSATNLADNSYAEEEAQRERQTDLQVEQILREVRIWRVANSAQWVAWGIVQAKVPELDAAKPDAETESVQQHDEKENDKPLSSDSSVAEGKGPDDVTADPAKDAEQPEGEEEEEFDYLAYAQDRAMFFWGDVVGLGLVKKEELPEKLVSRLKIVDY